MTFGMILIGQTFDHNNGNWPERWGMFHRCYKDSATSYLVVISETVSVTVPNVTEDRPVYNIH